MRVFIIVMLQGLVALLYVSATQLQRLAAQMKAQYAGPQPALDAEADQPPVDWPSMPDATAAPEHWLQHARPKPSEHWLATVAAHAPHLLEAEFPQYVAQQPPESESPSPTRPDNAPAGEVHHAANPAPGTADRPDTHAMESAYDAGPLQLYPAGKPYRGQIIELKSTPSPVPDDIRLAQADKADVPLPTHAAEMPQMTERDDGTPAARRQPAASPAVRLFPYQPLADKPPESQAVEAQTDAHAFDVWQSSPPRQREQPEPQPVFTASPMDESSPVHQPAPHAPPAERHTEPETDFPVSEYAWRWDEPLTNAVPPPARLDFEPGTAVSEDHRWPPLLDDAAAQETEDLAPAVPQPQRRGTRQRDLDTEQRGNPWNA